MVHTDRLVMVLHTDPYKGTARKVVLAIDIGTTFSGAAYCVLDPGEVPKVISVTRCARDNIYSSRTHALASGSLDKWAKAMREM